MKHKIIYLFLFNFFFIKSTIAQPLPVPDHIVLLVLEDHSYSQIIGNAAAPYINSLAADSSTALFTQSFGITHPSQPNYIHLFSGCSQGIANNLVPVHPLTADNLASQLLDSGKTFYSYHEDLPYPGFDGPTNGFYSRNHNPASNWMGSGLHQYADTLVQPLTSFPFSNFTLLPTFCFVIPNDSNSMDWGNDPAKITVADAWLQTHLDSYIQWCKQNNSLFILTFDEDALINTPIVTMIIGEQVQGGQYSNLINHHNVLRTIEDIFGLRYACDAAFASPITNCWRSPLSIKNNDNKMDLDFQLSPVPFNNLLNVTSKQDMIINSLSVKEITGKIIYKVEKITFSSKNNYTINMSAYSPGFYFVEINGDNKVFFKKVIKSN